MEEILKQDKNSSHKEFEKLLSEDLSNRKLNEGEIITGVVSSIGKKHIFVDISAKSEGAIPIEEFKLTKEIDKIEVGSKIEVFLEKIENFSGDVVISREKVRCPSRPRGKYSGSVAKVLPSVTSDPIVVSARPFRRRKKI